MWSLERVVSKEAQFRQKIVPVKERKLLANNIKKKRYGIMRAVKDYVGLENETHALKVSSLKQDITNIASYVFRDHTKSAQYFCKDPKQNETNVVSICEESGLFQDIVAVTEIEIVRNAKSLTAMLAKSIDGKRISFLPRRS